MTKNRIMPRDHWDWTMPVPFSQGWRVGNLLFTGGQISADGQGNVIGVGDIETQTRNVFANLSKVLTEGGAEWTDVVKLNTYYVFEGEGDELRKFWERMTRVRMEFLPVVGPAATAVRVAGLGYADLLIEADAIAVIEG